MRSRIKIILALLAICFFNSALMKDTYAQNWAPTGAVWYYSNGENIFSQDQGYFKVESIGDTLVLGKTCKKLLVTRVNHNNNSFIYGLEIMYSSGDTIFRLSDNNQFYVLYNFSAQPGDTWIVRSYDHCLGYDTSATIRLDSVSNTIINSQTLKILYTTTINGYLSYGYRGPIIEKLGATYHWMLPGDWGMCDFDIRAGLRCYEDSIFGFYQSNISPSCEYLVSTGVNELLLQNFDIGIFPNPFTSSAIIYLSENIPTSTEKFQLTIFDLVGQKVKEVQVNEKQTTLYRDNLPDGIYFYRLKEENLVITNGKFILQ